MRNVLILGATGNVGRGLTEAFYRNRWNVYAVDPSFSTTNNVSSSVVFGEQKDVMKAHGKEDFKHFGQLKCFSLTVEDLFESSTWSDFFHQEIHNEAFVNSDETHIPITICYAAENGNRDKYALDPEIADKNMHRFSTFIKRLSEIIRRENHREGKDKIGSHSSDTKAVSVRIFYCGGSWTRRQTSDDGTFTVNDDSPTKKNGGDNPYERAKTLSCSSAENIAIENQDWCQICFIDYISVVPNFASNFTIYKMVESSIQEGKIVYSDGDEYGRPLLHTRDAGQIIVLLASKEKLTPNIANEEADIPFRIVLLPGRFTAFRKFASIVKDVVTQNTNPVSALIMEKQKFTPDFLRSQCISSELDKEIGFVADESLIEEALRECALQALANVT